MEAVQILVIMFLDNLYLIMIECDQIINTELLQLPECSAINLTHNRYCC